LGSRAYYGTEQGFAGPEEAERFWLPGWGGHTRGHVRAAFSAGEKAGLAFQDLVAEMGLITSCPGSGSSVRQVSNASTTRGTDVLVDAQLNPPGSSLTVIMNSALAGGVAAGVHPVGSELPVRQAVSGAAYLEIREVGPSEALVLVNRP
jgi:hypothetical protein